MHMFCENYSLSVSPERISTYTVSVYYICSMCTTLFNETCANKTAALPTALPRTTWSTTPDDH